MALFTDPVVLNDGVDAARSFTKGGPIESPGANISSFWYESAAAVATESRIYVKHMVAKSGQKRHLVQIAQNYNTNADANGNSVSAPIIVSFTIAHHPDAKDSDIELQYTLAKDALAEDILAGLLRGDS